MREPIEMLVPRFIIHTEIVDNTKVRQRKRPTARMHLAYGEKTAVVTTSGAHGGVCCTPADQVMPLLIERELALSR